MPTPTRISAPVCTCACPCLCVFLQCMSPVSLESSAGLKSMTRGGVVFARLSLTHASISVSRSLSLSPAVFLCPCSLSQPRAGSRVERVDPLHFLARCRTRRLNQALSLLSFSLGFFSECICCRATFCVVLFVCSVAWLFLLGCLYQCKLLTGKTRLRNDL